ncbi:hypothetical protein STRTUCAR8_02452 [Streptomyces turgidiscabies Car8]|uniref:Uncharacterized protein n=1 Tax=Streptomyces turgidiscabies (strain Car8) TaxID=698760 RepID=L7FF56_STRT8|nr:hypothetical protein STRTUCAR8_02452 [Streptomyces turgidiscabies Car8]
MESGGGAVRAVLAGWGGVRVDPRWFGYAGRPWPLAAQPGACPAAPSLSPALPGPPDKWYDLSAQRR